MLGSIIHFGDRCHRVRLLMPWYVTDRLDQGERVMVDAHLAACADCRADLIQERGLKAEIVELPVDVENGWATLRDCVTRRRPRARPAAPGLVAAFAGLGGDWRGAAPWLRWSLAAQFGLLLLVAGVLALPRLLEARYHGLSAANGARTGDIVVVFRPETTEGRLRDILTAAGARAVDGPTSTDAFLVYAPKASRATALARLRQAPQVVLAEPVDAGGSP